MNERVLVFGSTGLLGGHVVRNLIKIGYKVFLYNRTNQFNQNLPGYENKVDIEVGSLLDTEKIIKLMSTCDSVIFCATPYPIYTLGWKKRWRHDDLPMLNSILYSAYKSRIRKFIYTSVSRTIGAPEDDALATENIHLQNVKNGCLLMKYLAEEQILKSVQHGVPAVILNPTQFFGSYDTKPSTGLFIKAAIKYPFDILKNAKLNIIDVNDVAIAHVNAIEYGEICTSHKKRYLVGNLNTTFGDTMSIIRQYYFGCDKSRIEIPYKLIKFMSVGSELLGKLTSQKKPLIPQMGLALLTQGSNHVSSQRAIEQLRLPQTPVQQSIEEAVDYLVSIKYLPPKPIQKEY